MLELTAITGNMLLSTGSAMDAALYLACAARQLPMAIDGNGWVYVLSCGHLYKLARYARLR